MEVTNLNRLTYFAAVVDAGSFTRAAERLGISKTVVSQQVARLETDLKTNLLVRTTRRVSPTEAGRALHARCTVILREAEEAFDEIAQANSEPAGVLRVAAPNDYGAQAIAPVAAVFTQQYPSCRVELTLSDAKIDLVEHQMDLSVRVGWLDDSEFQMRRIGVFEELLVAPPALAAAFSTRSPEDLVSVPFVANTALREPLNWRFSREGEKPVLVQVRNGLAINTTPAVLAAVLAGGGISVLPDFLVADDLQEGRLVHLLPEWKLPVGGIYVLYPPARFRQAKVARFVDLLVKAVARP